MINLRVLEYLVELANERNFRKAAEICFVSQPALSIQIQKLEKFLGGQLVERNNKSVLLTPLGENVVAKSRVLLKQIMELKHAAKSYNNPFCGELKLGIVPTLAPYLLPIIIPALTKKYPELTVYLAEEQTACLIKKLAQGEFDAVILATSIKEPGLFNYHLFEEELMLAVHKKHQFSKRKRINQNELRTTQLLALEDEYGIWDQALSLCYKDMPKFRRFRATSLETLRHMVGAGVGLTLIPKLACDTNPSIAYIPFSHPKPKRTVSFTWRASSNNIACYETIAYFMKNELQAYTY